jgi:serine/threonine protein kinase
MFRYGIVYRDFKPENLLLDTQVGMAYHYICLLYVMLC